jgi:hypothetical protein
MEREVVSVVVGEKDKPRRGVEPIVLSYSDGTTEENSGSYADAEREASAAGLVSSSPTPDGMTRWIKEDWETYTEAGQTKVRPIT